MFIVYYSLLMICNLLRNIYVYLLLILMICNLLIFIVYYIH